MIPELSFLSWYERHLSIKAIVHEFNSSLSNVTLCISYIVYFLSNNLAFHFSEGHNNTCTMKYITLMDKEISTLMRLLKTFKTWIVWDAYLILIYFLMLLWELCHLRHHIKSNYYFIYSTTKALKGHGDFQKKPLVNRYIELCNPFSRISNSFPRIGHLVLSDCNSFPRIRQFVLSNCNPFPRIAIRSLGLDNPFSRIAIRSL